MNINPLLAELTTLKTNLHQKDFLLTWEKSQKGLKFKPNLNSIIPTFGTRKTKQGMRKPKITLTYNEHRNRGVKSLCFEKDFEVIRKVNVIPAVSLSISIEGKKLNSTCDDNALPPVNTGLILIRRYGGKDVISPERCK